MAESAVCSLHDQKVVGSNPAASNSDRLVSITRIDGYIMSDKYDMEFPDTESRSEINNIQLGRGTQLIKPSTHVHHTTQTRTRPRAT